MWAFLVCLAEFGGSLIEFNGEARIWIVVENEAWPVGLSIISAWRNLLAIDCVDIQLVGSSSDLPERWSVEALDRWSRLRPHNRPLFCSVV